MIRKVCGNCEHVIEAHDEADSTRFKTILCMNKYERTSLLSTCDEWKEIRSITEILSKNNFEKLKQFPQQICDLDPNIILDTIIQGKIYLAEEGS